MFNITSKAVRKSATWNPASVAANTVAVQTVTVTGLETNMTVIALDVPVLSVALGIAGAYVSAKDTLAIRVINPTAGALDADAVTIKVLAAKL